MAELLSRVLPNVLIPTAFGFLLYFGKYKSCFLSELFYWMNNFDLNLRLALFYFRG
jgi:hypothetical protein